MLEQRAVLLERLLQRAQGVRGAEAAPGDQVGARGDGGGRVDLEEGQPLDDREQLGRPGCVEQLRAHRDPAGLLLREPVHGHEATSGYAVSSARATTVRQLRTVTTVGWRREVSARISFERPWPFGTLMKSSRRTWVSSSGA